MAESLEDNVGRRGVLAAAVCCLFLCYAFLSLSLSLSRTACYVEKFIILTKDSSFGRFVQSCFEVPTRKGGERFANFHLQFCRWFVCFVFWRLRKKRCHSELCSSQLVESEHHTNNQPTNQPKGWEEFELKQHLRQKKVCSRIWSFVVAQACGDCCRRALDTRRGGGRRGERGSNEVESPVWAMACGQWH